MGDAAREAKVNECDALLNAVLKVFSHHRFERHGRALDVLIRHFSTGPDTAQPLSDKERLRLRMFDAWKCPWPDDNFYETSFDHISPYTPEQKKESRDWVVKAMELADFDTRPQTRTNGISCFHKLLEELRAAVPPEVDEA